MTDTQQFDDTVRFVMDGEVHEVRRADPNLTVLRYLRERLRRTGTKEGCAEGDCGACTMVVGEAVGDRLRLRAVNSCIQFLPTLDGKELFTVESLTRAAEGLHPVQRAMVDYHGSQCGFCTPGIVMSLFAMYKSETVPSRQRIRDVLSGNLCRCTGYGPILEAARRMYSHESAGARDWLCRPRADAGRPSAEESERVERLRSLRRSSTLRYSGTGLGGRRRTFLAPRTLEDLAALRLEHPDARLLAGGTDVALWVTKQRMDLDEILYVGNVEELARLEVSDGHLEIGAAVTVTDAQELIGAHYPDMGELYRRYGSPPIRNAATIGGNVANGSPIGDSMPGLIALGAILVLRRGSQSRELPIDRFYLGYGKTDLRRGELLERIRVPLPDPAERFGTYKVSKRFDQDISAVCGAYRLRLAEGGRIEEARVAYGGMAEIPKRAAGCEAVLRGQRWGEETLEAAQEALDGDFTPIGDMRASAGYRRLVARNLLRRFFLETSDFGGETRVLGRRAAAGG